MLLDKIRWGVVGAGNVFENKSGPALCKVPNSELVAVMRTNAAKAEETARRHGAQRWYTDAQSLIADPDVNAVYIASPHYLHQEHVALAARAGKIVLCEKPVGINTVQARQAVDVCKANGVSLTVAYYRRFWDVVRAMKNFLYDGAIGEVVTARAQLSDWFNGDAERGWLTARAKSGGGALANAGAHWIDLIRFLLGEVTDVMADASSKGRGWEIDDTTIVQMRMANGALASLISTFCSPISVNELDISGTEGRLYASPLSEGHLILHRRGREPEILNYPRKDVVHMGLIAELVPRLLRGEPSPLPGEEAVAVWKIMDAAYRSSTEGIRVAVK
ncbi:MAG: Gfo/Idh/MocA family oxidoreductase [Kiritimatiellae bacterium]|nr:Gfo/Idh/MocA family oxidoreductase [Kiritimatiellia bacterium]MDD5523133.1 Gfo/Idh/MocA family oxidoreductase [Kiritimatiellia bacterium]